MIFKWKTINQIYYFVLVQQPSDGFIPSNCSNTSYIGQNCSLSNSPCDMQKPCQNNGTCYNNPNVQNGYTCVCPHGFNDSQCRSDYRVCKPNICLNNGINSLLTSNTTFSCSCQSGWEGDHCETSINYCLNVTCMNKGMCVRSSMNYTCICLDRRYSGRHCEIKTNGIVVCQNVSKSLVFLTIIVMIMNSCLRQI